MDQVHLNKFRSRASGHRDWVETTKDYVGALIAAGHARKESDGQIVGIASDGTEVQLGHIADEKLTPTVARKDWARLGDYLSRCPLPENW